MAEDLHVPCYIFGHYLGRFAGIKTPDSCASTYEQTKENTGVALGVYSSGVRAERRLLSLKGRRLVLGQRLLPVALQVLQAQESVHAIARHAHQLQVAAWQGCKDPSGKRQQTS